MIDGIFTIALDGPAAAGKGTISRALAEHYQIPHLDTGLLYRAVGAESLVGIDPIKAALSFHITLLENPDRLRTRDIAQAASQVAVIPEVREALLEFQRKFAKQSGGAVLDGRDIGTMICPDANAKFFVTADPEIRAQRRLKELLPQNSELTFDKVLQDIKERDERDRSREDAPMIKADDALLLDTSKLSIDAAIAKAVRFIEEKRSV